jgi:hypothetical protein
LSNVGSTFHLNVLGTPTAPEHLIRRARSR